MSERIFEFFLTVGHSSFFRAKRYGNIPTGTPGGMQVGRQKSRSSANIWLYHRSMIDWWSLINSFDRGVVYHSRRWRRCNASVNLVYDSKARRRSCRAMLASSAALAVMRCLSVCLSVCHVRGLCQNWMKCWNRRFNKVLGNSHPNSVRQYLGSLYYKSEIISLIYILREIQCCIDLLSRLHTSKAYSTIGKHFCFRSWTITSSKLLYQLPLFHCCPISVLSNRSKTAQIMSFITGLPSRWEAAQDYV